jgi:hypothetical protein
MRQLLPLTKDAARTRTVRPLLSAAPSDRAGDSCNSQAAFLSDRASASCLTVGLRLMNCDQQKNAGVTRTHLPLAFSCARKGVSRLLPLSSSRPPPLMCTYTTRVPPHLYLLCCLRCARCAVECATNRVRSAKGEALGPRSRESASARQFGRKSHAYAELRWLAFTATVRCVRP